MRQIEGWRISVVVMIALVVMACALFVFQGDTEEALRSFIRGSARIALVLFLLAFVASSLHLLCNRPVTAWLLGNRRYMGVTFAMAHFTHLLAVVILGVYYPHPFLDDLSAFTVVTGGLAYLFVAAMAATSFTTTKRLIGRKKWTLLHTIGGYYVWIGFAQSYLLRALEEISYTPFALVIAIVLVLRVWRHRKMLKTASNKSA